MVPKIIRWPLTIAILAVPLISQAQPAMLALTNARIYPANQPPIDNGVMLVENGKVVAVAGSDALDVPSGATVVDMAGKVIIPGLVDTHSHVGIGSRPSVAANSDYNESSKPVNPELRAIDSIWPADPGIRIALAGGITTGNIMPGSGNVIGGQTAYVKYRGDTIEEMLIPGSIGGLKMANGENPKGNFGSRNLAPGTRMAVASLARQAFLDARAYRAKQEAWRKTGRKKGEPEPAVNLGHEALLEVLDGKRVVQHHSHRADDIMTVLRLAQEFDYRVVIQHGTEAWKVADQLAARNIPVSLIVVDSPGGKQEALNLSYLYPERLRAAGVKVAIHTDDFIVNSRFLLRSAALAVRGGLDEQSALRAVTLNAAEMLDLGERIGSLESGKDADFVVLSGSPFSVYSRVEQTWIEGEKVFDRSRTADRLYATGGFNVANRYPTPIEGGSGQ